MKKRWSLTVSYISENGYEDDEEWLLEIAAPSTKSAKKNAMDTVRQAVKDKLAEDPYNMLACRLEFGLKYYSPHWKKIPPLGYQRYYQSDYQLRKNDIGVFITLHPFYKLSNGIQIPEWS